MTDDRAHAIADLRGRIDQLERGRRPRHPSLSTGIEALDAHLPGGGLARGALHEVVGGGVDPRHGAAAALFAASLLAGGQKPVLWVLAVRDLFPAGIAAAGLHPDRVIYAETGSADAVLPVAEEGLRHPGLAGVVAEVARITVQASRRLQLAAEASGVTAIVIRRWAGRGEPEMAGTVAATRWRLTAIASAPLDGVPGLGDPRWRLELVRCRGGATGTWILEACDETDRLRLAPDLADRPAQADARRAAAG